MYVDIRRGLVFFDQSDKSMKCPFLLRYDPHSGAASLVKGAKPDDVVCDVSLDGRCLALHSAEWQVVRGTLRSRLTLIRDADLRYETDRFIVYWSRFDPTGQHALVSGLGGEERAAVIDAEASTIAKPVGRAVDARYGDIDPIFGKLWVPNQRRKDHMLAVDCRTGEIKEVGIRIGGKIARIRFSRNGAVMFVLGWNDELMCCDRKGSVMWSKNVNEYGEVRGGKIFFNESESHMLLSLSETDRNRWGEDIIISVADGIIENTISRFRGPPARIASEWFGDHILTYTGEIVDFYTGKIVDKIELNPSK